MRLWAQAATGGLVIEGHLIKAPDMVWNTKTTFGSVSKLLHWFGALLIFAMIALGIWAVQYPLETPEQMAAKWELFALHKTVGVCAFGLSVLRLISMVFQTKPLPLKYHGAREVFGARTVHWLLTFLMILVPLAGWVRHASLPGFAPLYLPFGDSLPFIPADQNLSEIASMTHFGFIILLLSAVALHVAGALKHHLIDRDNTLKRMLPGQGTAQVQAAPTALPALLVAIALIIGVAAIAILATPQV
ncbi:MAG: cytochrome b [Paracoccaceae bacterium]